MVYGAPTWACPKWGDWEHDWLDCPECCKAYEQYMESKDGND